MKIYAHHDPDGRVRGVFSVNAPDEVGMMLVPKPGVIVTELVGVTVKEGKGHIAALQKLAKTHRIKPATPAPKGRKQR